MIRCTNCREHVRGEPDEIGARCPNCRQPLYEDPRLMQALGPGATAGSHCATHAQSPAVGTCQRCGNYLCAVCRTRWRNQALCVACIGRALEAREASPIEARAHVRQAILAVAFGAIAWLMTLAGVGLIFGGTAGGGEPNLFAVGMGMLLLMPTPLPAVFGVGQGAAAIRARGNHMILATLGLILSGLHVGITLGFLTFSMWQNN